MPAHNFADIAVALRCAAQSFAIDAEQAEMLAARFDSRGMDRAVRDTQSQAALLGEAHNLIRDLIGCEDEVRALLQRNKPRDGAARKMDQVLTTG
jgi:hypothetical protein